jgi:hypothetical protein
VRGHSNSMFTGKFFKKRELGALAEEARTLQSHGRYAEAAEKYSGVASGYLEENPLIYASYSHQAFRMWLKARNGARALEQARAVLQVLDDTGWLKQSMEQVLDLILMIDEFRLAGNTVEADSFAGNLNNRLAEFGLMLKPSGGEARLSICPACGAQLPHADPGEELRCSFCGYIVPVMKSLS